MRSSHSQDSPGPSRYVRHAWACLMRLVDCWRPSRPWFRAAASHCPHCALWTGSGAPAHRQGKPSSRKGGVLGRRSDVRVTALEKIQALPLADHLPVPGTRKRLLLAAAGAGAGAGAAGQVIVGMQCRFANRPPASTHPSLLRHRMLAAGAACSLARPAAGKASTRSSLLSSFPVPPVHPAPCPRLLAMDMSWTTTSARAPTATPTPVPPT